MARLRSAAERALYTVHPVHIWRFLQAQPLSFWLINLYLFFEYVRPQSIYSWLAGPPWAQIILILTILSVVLERKAIRLTTPVDGFICAFSLVIVLSSVQAYAPQVSRAYLMDYFSWVVIYILISSIVTTERQFLVFMLAFLLYSFKMSQHAAIDWAMSGFAFRGWGVTGAPGWFQNSGEYGVQMTIFIPLATYFTISLQRHWGRVKKAFFYAMLVSAVIGTVGSTSRGAMLGAAAVLMFMLGKTRYKFRGAAVLGATALLVALLLPPESLDRFRAMGEDETSTSRIEYWQAGLDAMEQYPVLGIGYANWQVYMRTEGEIGLSHNIFIQAGAELGYIGLLTLLAGMIATFVVNQRTRKMMKAVGEHGRFIAAMAHGLDAALIGFMVSGSFVTVLYYPFFWINLAMTVALHKAAQDKRRQMNAPAATRRNSMVAQRAPGLA